MEVAHRIDGGISIHLKPGADLSRLGYPGLTNTSVPYIGGGEHYYPYPNYRPDFSYTPEELLPNIALTIDDVSGGPTVKSFSRKSKCPITIADLERPKVYVNNGFSFETILPSVFSDYTFTSIHRPEDWRPPSNGEKAYVTFLNMVVGLVTAGCGIGTRHLYSSDPLMRSVYRFHVYYASRRLLRELGVKRPTSSGFDPWGVRIDASKLPEIGRRFSMKTVAPDSFSWTYDPRRFVQDGKSGNYQVVNSFAGYIPDETSGITPAGRLLLSESIRGYVYLLISAQAAVRASVVGQGAANLEAQRAFATNLEEYIDRASDVGKDISRYQTALESASSPVNFSMGPGLYMLPGDLALQVGTKKGYNNNLLVGPASSLGKTTGNTVVKKDTSKAGTNLGPDPKPNPGPKTDSNKPGSGPDSEKTSHREELLSLALGAGGLAALVEGARYALGE